MITKKRLFRLVKEAIHSVDKEATIKLFGSRARGDYRKDSDWDFLILTNLPSDENLKHEIRSKLFDIQLNHEQVFTSIIHSQKEWNTKYTVTPLYYNIQKEGIRIC